MDKIQQGYADALKTYRIFHPYYGELNSKCERGKYMYDHVGEVLATDLEDAYFNAQNDFSSWADYGVRSTSIGDIIEIDCTYYMVVDLGFIEVPHTVVGYIDWGIVDSATRSRYEDYEDEIYGRGDE